MNNTPKVKQQPTKKFLVRLDPAQHAELAAEAASRGTTVAAFIRHSLAQALHPPMPKSSVDGTFRTRHSNYQPARKLRAFRLTDAEDALLQAQATQHGYTPQAYMLALLRTNLTGLPSPNKSEVEALDESTRQMRAIGTNLNQVVRKMNEMRGMPDGLAAAIQKVRDAIAAHTSHVDRVLKASAERWT